MLSLSPKRRRTLRNIFAILIVLSVLLVFWGLTERNRGRKQLAAIKAELKQRGYKTSIAEYKYPVTHATLESRLKGIGNIFQTNRPWGLMTRLELAPGRSVRGSQAPHPIFNEVKVAFTNDHAEIISGELTTWQIIERLHSANEAGLAEIRELTRTRVPSAARDYSIHLPLRNAAWGMSDAIMRQLYRGELKEAKEDLVAMAGLLRMFKEASIIHSMVKAGISEIGAGLIWDALQSEGWTEEDLQQIQAAWSSTDILSGVAEALHFERVSKLEWYGKLESHSYADWRALIGKEYAGTSVSLPIYPLKIELSRHYVFHPIWRNLFAEQEMAAYLKRTEFMTELPQAALLRRSFAEVMGEFARLSNPNNGYGNWRFYAYLPYMDEELFYVNGSNVPEAGISSEMVYKRWGKDFKMYAFSKTVKTAVARQNDLSMALTAIALKCYSLRHGEYPERLKQLVPEFAKKLENDWLSGQSFRYHRESKSAYTLYGVGENGVDDGGAPEKDHVWPKSVPWTN